jgi:hypothetical protein
MELMSTSFDKFYKYVYSVLDDVIPEEILGKITLAVSIWLSRCWCITLLLVASVFVNAHGFEFLLPSWENHLW